jgi:hypothetical protein
MTHDICRACETVSHCMKNGCIPIQTEPAPIVWPVLEQKSIQEKK